jgi:hypothetical protein
MLCYKHKIKLAIDAVGNNWCPKCVGEKMAKEVSKKLKLNLGV